MKVEMFLCSKLVQFEIKGAFISFQLPQHMYKLVQGDGGQNVHLDQMDHNGQDR